MIAAPLGSYLGSIIGWRGAFFALVPVALIALVWQWIALPAMKVAARAPGSGNVFKVLKSRTVAYGMAACGAFFMGQFALFTYLRPFLETVTHVSMSTLSLLLLVIGVAGFIGTVVIGTILKHGLYGPLITIPTLMSVIAVVLIPLGAWVVPVAVLLGLWGLMATATPVGWWSWIAQAMPHDAEAGGGLPVRHCLGLDRGRRAVRYQRIPEHVRGQRDRLADRRVLDLPGLADACTARHLTSVRAARRTHAQPNLRCRRGPPEHPASRGKP